MDNPSSIVFHGNVNWDHLPVYYSAASALVMPRRFNATPRVALEALCNGTPIIANQTASLEGFPVVADAIRNLDFAQSDLPQDLLPWIEEQATRQNTISAGARSVFDATTVSTQLLDLYQILPPSHIVP